MFTSVSCVLTVEMSVAHGQYWYASRAERQQVKYLTKCIQPLVPRPGRGKCEASCFGNRNERLLSEPTAVQGFGDRQFRPHFGLCGCHCNLLLRF
jgi:hypothetical protein